MTGPCQAPVDGGQFVRATLGFIDCHALSIGETGYRALAAPHSSLSLVVTALFTILIALIGYRLLLGEQVRLRDGVLAIAKVGVVLALTTGWSGYRTLFFDVALRGPAELAAEIGSPMQLPGAGGGLADRLQGVDDGFAALLNLDAERNVLAVAQPMQTPNSGLFAPASTATPPSRIAPLPPVDIVSLRSARQFVLVGALGSFAATRLLAGILLAIGPFFIAFLLFDATRGLFVGWLRVLGGAALGAFGASLVVGVGIAYFEPVLANLVAQRTAGTPMSDSEAMLLPASLIFALATLAILIGMARVAAGLRWPVRAASVVIDTLAEQAPPRSVAAGSAGNVVGQPASAERSRALAVADAVAVAGQVHRERSATIDGAIISRAGPMTRKTDDPGMPQVPLGQTFRRQPRGRISAGMNRRNAS